MLTGAEQGIDRLMERAADLYRLAYGITRSHAEAEAVLRAVLVRAAAGEAASEKPAWGRRAVVRAALARQVPAGPEVAAVGAGALPAFSPDGHRLGAGQVDRADWSGLPDAALLGGAGRAALERALDALPVPVRAALLLRDVERLAWTEVAEALGEPVATARTWLHRARMAVREQLTRALAATPDALAC
jgi:RNA polymerase sigma-70 factor (ECF subfamily)